MTENAIFIYLISFLSFFFLKNEPMHELWGVFTIPNVKATDFILLMYFSHAIGCNALIFMGLCMYNM